MKGEKHNEINREKSITILKILGNIIVDAYTSRALDVMHEIQFNIEMRMYVPFGMWIDRVEGE